MNNLTNSGNEQLLFSMKTYFYLPKEQGRSMITTTQPDLSSLTTLTISTVIVSTAYSKSMQILSCTVRDLRKEAK